MKMQRKPWDKKYRAEVTIDSDANDYFYEWVDLEGCPDFEDLIREANLEGHKVIVKVRDGAIFIVRESEEGEKNGEKKE
jgi:hypothetical protein